MIGFKHEDIGRTDAFEHQFRHVAEIGGKTDVAGGGAQQITDGILSVVRDGEGVSRIVTVSVNGAKSFADADAAARAVANSALVKTSWHGGDPNWGRIIDAIGYSPATVVEEKIGIGYSAVGGKKILWSLKRGQPTKATFKELCAAVAPKEFELHINLNLGRANAVMYAADLTEEYVDFNKGDVGDPSSLGG